MKSLFNENAFTEIKQRFERLNTDSLPQWGKMDAGQMAWHCQGPLNIMLQKNHYNLKPNWFAKILFKKSLYNDKLWIKNLPTAKFLKVTTKKDFETEKDKLTALINEVGEQREKVNWGTHPGFGHFTDQQWGQMQYKHLDHHLRQFNL